MSKYYQGVIASFVAVQRAKLDKLGAEVSALKEQSRRAVILLAALCVAFGVFCSWWLTRSITVPLHEAVAAAEQLQRSSARPRVPQRPQDRTGKSSDP